MVPSLQARISLTTGARKTPSDIHQPGKAFVALTSLAGPFYLCANPSNCAHFISDEMLADTMKANGGIQVEEFK